MGPTPALACPPPCPSPRLPPPLSPLPMHGDGRPDGWLSATPLCALKCTLLRIAGGLVWIGNGEATRRDEGLSRAWSGADEVQSLVAHSPQRRAWCKGARERAACEEQDTTLGYASAQACASCRGKATLPCPLGNNLGK